MPRTRFRFADRRRMPVANPSFATRSTRTSGLRSIPLGCFVIESCAVLWCCPGLAQSAAAGVVHPGRTADSAWSLTYENDVFVGSDKHYTGGIELVVKRKKLVPGAVARAMLAPACRLSDCEADPLALVRDRFGQVIYTPEKISVARPQPDDRPWAGMLYYARDYEFVRDSGDSRTTFTAMIGIVGPGSGAAETQRWIHETFGKAQPRGWDNQIGAELGLMAMLERRRGMQALSFTADGGVQLNTTTHWRVAVGNLMTFAGAGATVALGKRLHKTSERDNPLSVRTVSHEDGTCLFSWLRCGVFGSLDGRLMLRNIFLDGALFRSGPSVDSRPVVVDASLGIRFDFPRTRNDYTGPWYLSFMVTNRSPEFRSARRATSQKFGSLTVGTEF